MDKKSWPGEWHVHPRPELVALLRMNWRAGHTGERVLRHRTKSQPDGIGNMLFGAPSLRVYSQATLAPRKQLLVFLCLGIGSREICPLTHYYVH